MSEPAVIYEDQNFVAVNKPAGLLTHPLKLKMKSEKLKSGEPTLAGWLLGRYPEIKNVGDDPKIRPGIVHRLDKDTSGIILVPRNQKYFEYLKSLFAGRKIKKTYIALVFGKISEKQGVINAPIGIKAGSTRRSVRSRKMLKEAVTEYRLSRYVDCDVENVRTTGKEICSLLEVMPKTGRTHQIRVHLASIGHPVVGDKLYGRKARPEWAKRLMLHALSLEFNPTEGQRLRLEAPLPEEFASF